MVEFVIEWLADFLEVIIERVAGKTHKKWKSRKRGKDEC